ncbi:MAG: hypothetical protein ACRDY5_08080, partial [Acidimicrobiales bacterium]
RTTGEPGSANGASSFHLRWRLPGTERDLTEVAAVLEVRRPPAVPRLHFWALQVSFAGGAGAHVGLQWNPRHPDNRAANWGGYGAGGRLLDGTTSPLPSAPDDPNTRDFPWEPGRRYRLRVAPTPGRPGWWRADICDLDNRDLEMGTPVVVRDLAGGGDRLFDPVVWSEVFACCDHPSTTVRWSGLEAVTADGEGVRPDGVSVSYEPGSAGGCDNTTVVPDGDGFLQVTRAERTVAPGAVLGLSPV